MTQSRTNDEAAPAPPPRRRRRRWVLGILLLLVLTPLAIWAGWTMSLRSEINRRLAAIRAAGEPTTLKELDAWYVVPKGENAADLYIAAMDAMVEDKELENKLPDLGEGEVKWPAWDAPLDADTLAAMHAYLDKNAEALRLLKEAGRVRECRYPLDLTVGLSLLMPELGRLRSAARKLRMEAVVHAIDSEPAKATDSIVAMMRAARSLKQEPTLISQLVRISIDAMAFDAMERCVELGHLDDEQLMRLRAGMTAAMGHDPFRRAMAGERATALAIFNGEHPTGAGDEGYGYPRIPGIADRDKLEYLRLFDLGLELLDNPASPVDLTIAAKDIPAYCILTRLLLPATDTAARTELLHEASMRCGVTAIAVKQYQLAHGKLPTTLDELVPRYMDKLYTDPFDDKPLRYVVKDDTAKIYSIGKDRIDNGGVAQDANGDRHTNGTDVVFRVK